MDRKVWLVFGAVVVIAFATTVILTAPADAGKLEEAIAKTPQGTGVGMIDPQAAPGFMGIPGAPKSLLLWYILWGIWVGWIFSSVGAFGGVMAGVGHITVFGLADYGKTFNDTNPAVSKLLTDSIRVCNQYLAGLTALISSITYWRMGRLVMPLALCLAGGGVLGAILIPVLTAGKVNLSSYIGYFGIVVFQWLVCSFMKLHLQDKLGERPQNQRQKLSKTLKPRRKKVEQIPLMREYRSRVGEFLE